MEVFVHKQMSRNNRIISRLTNSWSACHMNVQEKAGLDTKVFDWHTDSQPLTLVINVSDMPKEAVGGSTLLMKYDDKSVIELKQPAPGYAALFRGSAVLHKERTSLILA